MIDGFADPFVIFLLDIGVIVALVDTCCGVRMDGHPARPERPDGRCIPDLGWSKAHQGECEVELIDCPEAGSIRFHEFDEKGLGRFDQEGQALGGFRQFDESL